MVPFSGFGNLATVAPPLGQVINDRKTNLIRTLSAGLGYAICFSHYRHRRLIFAIHYICSSSE
jgi:hypothetical protein